MMEGTEILGATGVVATGPAEAARVGARLFEQGGNAFDAAAAACLACAVIEPQACDLGGYVAAGVVLDAATGSLWSIDANSVAPMAAREEMFEVVPPEPGKRGINEIEYGCSVRDDANIYGPLAVGVPGFVAGVGTMQERWGRRPWSDVVSGALELAAFGLDESQIRASFEIKREPMARYGAAWHRPDLARTLSRLAWAGWRDFYTGAIGRMICDCVASQGGILTRADMAAYAPRVTEPLAGRYREARLYTAIAPNGGSSVLDALAELGAEPACSSHAVDYWERMAQALQRMWRRRLGTTSAGSTPHGTIHVAAADRDGNLVSMTISQGGLFGSCLAVPETGIILAHGMCRFDPHPGLENSPGPGKRPLNNVCPMIVRLPDRDVAIGARGGRRIVSVCPQFVQRIVDEGASVRAAAEAPRIHMLTGEPLEISANFDPILRERLAELGHHITVPNEVAGAAHGAEILRPAGGLRAGGNTWAAGF
jgi:gamma-glutamyltranspeptidase/glutathione hydrolase